MSEKERGREKHRYCQNIYFLNTAYAHFILMIVKILCSLLFEKSNENIILSMLIMLPCLGSDYLITIFNTPFY